MRSVRDVVRVFPGFPATVRAAGPAVAMLVVAMCILGAIRLALANIAPPEPSQAFVEPSPEQLSGLAERLGLPQTPQYITADSFPAARYQLVSGKLPAQPAVYAVPGEFTRFLWNLSDYNRTIYWYVFSDHVRPTSLDLTRTRITAESVGNLTNAQFGNRQGLLIIFAESSYFDATGDIAQQNVLTARAFIPWDASSDRFLTDAPVTFPLNVPLYDDERYAAASIVGTVAETGPLRVQTGGRLFRALSFQPNAAMTDGEVGRQAAITYHNLWVPQSGHLQGWIALHPRLFGNASIGPLHVQVRVIANGATTIVSDYQLNPTNTSQRDYEPMDADLSAYGNETIDVQLRVLVSTVTGDGGEVLFGEPNLSVSN
ncbi:MAG: hypothetical protein JO020_12430 [Chloroflexi bacterium]|nr:hypothetical protein [Chloroflexota bacterium]